VHNREGADSGVEGFPLRHWSMKVVGVNADTKQDVEAEMFDKVVYNLHPSFGIKAKQSQFSKLEVRFTPENGPDLWIQCEALIYPII
jgi:transcription initiation factor IIF auxiliary subunit